MHCKAAVMVGDRSIEMREAEVPDVPPAGGAIVAVEGCGICGSDIEQYEGALVRMGWMRYPVIPGHEAMGRIYKIDEEGARRWGVKVGDRVAVHGIAPCGTCAGCMKQGRCRSHFTYGVHPFDVGSGLWGGFGEYMEIIPGTKLYPISDDLSIEDALLYNPLAAGFAWLIGAGGLRYGDSTLILGCGQRGLACVLAAVEAGASRIIVTGLRSDLKKLELARTFGATDTLVVEETDVAAVVKDLMQGAGVDVVVDTTPLAFQPLRDAIASVRVQGTIVVAGSKAGHNMDDFPIDMILHKQIKMQGVLSTGQWATQQAIRLVESRRYPLHLMHSHRFPLDRVEEAIKTLAGEIPGETPLHISIVHNQFW